MPRIYWLDDEPEQVEVLFAYLTAAGYDVRVFSEEANLVAALELSPPPDGIIQDLERPPSTAQVRGGSHRRLARELGSAGWLLYEDVLRPLFPAVPVLILSLDAWHSRHRQKASDYNLWLLQKNRNAPDDVAHLLRDALAAQVPIAPALVEAPAFLAADFARVNEALLRHLNKHPDDVHLLSWSSFEELVERILRELGYDVFHTALTRDGGVDLWAIQHTHLGDTLYAIDTKKYSRGRLVGPQHVRAIHGVISHEHATVGMIVTTSGFGPSAIKYADQHRYRLSLKDFNSVRQWIAMIVGGSG